MTEELEDEELTYLTRKLDALEQINSQIVISLIEISSTVAITVEKMLEESTQEEREEFGRKVNELQAQHAKELKKALDDISAEEDRYI